MIFLAGNQAAQNTPNAAKTNKARMVGLAERCRNLAGTVRIEI